MNFAKVPIKSLFNMCPNVPQKSLTKNSPTAILAGLRKKSCPYKCQLLVLTGSELCLQNSNKFLKKMNIMLNIFAILASVGFSFARQSIAQKNIWTLIDLLSSNQLISPVNNYLCIYDI